VGKSWSQSTGEEALRLFKAGAYELVILDHILPGISNIDVCALIRQLSDIPIVVSVVEQHLPSNHIHRT